MKINGQQIEKKTWWAPVWRGLVVDSGGSHYRAMHSALWLFVYLVIHADRKTGELARRPQTIAADMGVGIRTIRYWLNILRKHEYINLKNSRGSSTRYIKICKWRPIIRLS